MGGGKYGCDGAGWMDGWMDGDECWRRAEQLLALTNPFDARIFFNPKTRAICKCDDDDNPKLLHPFPSSSPPIPLVLLPLDATPPPTPPTRPPLPLAPAHPDPNRHAPTALLRLHEQPHPLHGPDGRSALDPGSAAQLARPEGGHGRGLDAGALLDRGQLLWVCYLILGTFSFTHTYTYTYIHGGWVGGCRLSVPPPSSSSSSSSSFLLSPRFSIRKQAITESE